MKKVEQKVTAKPQFVKDKMCLCMQIARKYKINSCNHLYRTR